ncbi:hypothetical protein Ancab_004643 [Ancistrocladus abbreviatus]
MEQQKRYSYTHLYHNAIVAERFYIVLGCPRTTKPLECEGWAKWRPAGRYLSLVAFVSSKRDMYTPFESEGAASSCVRFCFYLRAAACVGVVTSFVC